MLPGKTKRKTTRRKPHTGLRQKSDGPSARPTAPSAPLPEPSREEFILVTPDVRDILPREPLIPPQELSPEKKKVWVGKRLAQRQRAAEWKALDKGVWDMLHAMLWRHLSLRPHLLVLERLVGGFAQRWLTNRRPWDVDDDRRKEVSLQLSKLREAGFPPDEVIELQLLYDSIAGDLKVAWAKWMREWHRDFKESHATRQMPGIVSRVGELPKRFRFGDEVLLAQGAPEAVKRCLEKLRPLGQPSRDKAKNEAILAVVKYVKQRGLTDYRAYLVAAAFSGRSKDAVRLLATANTARETTPSPRRSPKKPSR